MARGNFRPTIVPWLDLDFEGMFPVFPDLRFLAEGDSWFTVSGFPAYNLLFELRFWKQTLIVNCGIPGDTIRNMSEISKNRNLREALSADGYRWDAILLSGGGNDLIDAADEIILPRNVWAGRPGRTVEDYCHAAKLDALLRDVQMGYRRIAASRESAGPAARRVPMLAHTYDHVTPRNAPARFALVTLGPWFFKAFTRHGIPQSDWIELADHLMDRLAESILALEHGPDPILDFHVVDTRGTLQRSDLGSLGDNHDWQNEIHPNGGGYEKLARRIEETLIRLLGEPD